MLRASKHLTFILVTSLHYIAEVWRNLHGRAWRHGDAGRAGRPVAAISDKERNLADSDSILDEAGDLEDSEAAILDKQRTAQTHQWGCGDPSCKRLWTDGHLASRLWTGGHHASRLWTNSGPAERLLTCCPAMLWRAHLRNPNPTLHSCGGLASRTAQPAQQTPQGLLLTPRNPRSVPSWALAQCAPLADIGRAAGWATPHTLARFYNLCVELSPCCTQSLASGWAYACKSALSRNFNCLIGIGNLS